MIAAWMLYCVLCAIAIAAVALTTEHALLARGGPVRHVWIGAIVLALLVPAVVFRFTPRPAATAVRAPMDSRTLAAPLVDSALTSTTPVAASEPSRSPARTWRASLGVLTPANRTLAIVWLVMSAALAVYFALGVALLAWMRRQWVRRDVLGVPILVSERTGPAVVGALAPSVVMPEWALAMKPTQLALMLRHEEEHRRAGDAQILMAAQLALIAMPWNAALWWLVVRLGMAVELDCDARVLRNADARSYGDLLLEVAKPRRGPSLVGATAFAERAGQLERRIRAITRRREQASRGARAAVAFVGLAVVSVAWVAPHPAVPPRSGAPQAAPVAGAVITEISKVATEAAQPAARAATTAQDTVLRTGRSLRGDTMIRIGMSDSLRGGRNTGNLVERVVSNEDPPIVDSALKRLLDGMALTPEQAGKARALIAKLAQLQDAQDKATMIASVQSAVGRIRIQARRDSALLALVSDDADRALLIARLSSMGGGRRGRSGSDSPPTGVDAAGGGRSGGGGMRGRGRVGGGGVPILEEVPVNDGRSMSDLMYARLFDGIPLSSEQQVVARTAITVAQQETLALLSEPPIDELRLLYSGGVAMRPESKAALSALLTNDADRSMLESRVSVEVRTVVKRPPGGAPQP